MLLEEGPPWGLWLWRSAKMTKAGGAGYTGARRQAVGSGLVSLGQLKALVAAADPWVTLTGHLSIY